jgi:hypothetical protein
MIKQMKRSYIQNRYYVKPVVVTDTSSLVVVPEEWTSIQDVVDGKSVMTCMLYHPKNMVFYRETRGIRVKIQDSFPNIKENRMHAWVCVNYFQTDLQSPPGIHRNEGGGKDVPGRTARETVHKRSRKGQTDWGWYTSSKDG